MWGFSQVMFNSFCLNKWQSVFGQVMQLSSHYNCILRSLQNLPPAYPWQLHAPGVSSRGPAGLPPLHHSRRHHSLLWIAVPGGTCQEYGGGIICLCLLGYPGHSWLGHRWALPDVLSEQGLEKERSLNWELLWPVPGCDIAGEGTEAFTPPLKLLWDVESRENNNFFFSCGNKSKDGSTRQRLPPWLADAAEKSDETGCKSLPCFISLSVMCWLAACIPKCFAALAVGAWPSAALQCWGVRGKARQLGAKNSLLSISSVFSAMFALGKLLQCLWHRAGLPCGLCHTLRSADGTG